MSRFITLSALALTLSIGCKKRVDTEPAVSGSIAPPVVQKAAELPTQISEMKANFSRVLFDLDSSELTGEGKEAMKANAAIMAQHTDIKVEIQGHADERGTTEYNLALGQRRAESVKRFLTAQGVAASRLSTLSYGEERPLAQGSSETAWSQNRRAEFRITWGGDNSVGGSI